MVSLEWDTSGIIYGRYDIEMEVGDLDGFILDRKNVYNHGCTKGG